MPRVIVLLWTVFQCMIITHNTIPAARATTEPAFQPRRMRVGIDYGPRIIGIARSDFLGSIQPYGTVANTGNLLDITQHILALAKSWGANEIIVGVPLDSNGVLSYAVRNVNGQICLNFSRVLTSVAMNEYSSSIRTVLYDERYTTQEAKVRMKTERIKASLDAMSACCLLERYIEDEGEGSMAAEPCISGLYPPTPEEATFDYSIIKQYVQEQHFYSRGTQQARIRNSGSKRHARNLKYGYSPRNPPPPRTTTTKAPRTSPGPVVDMRNVPNELMELPPPQQQQQQEEKEESIQHTTDIDSQPDCAGSTTGQPVASELELEAEDEQTKLMKEYEAIRAQRRKRGTLKSKSAK